MKNLQMLFTTILFLVVGIGSGQDITARDIMEKNENQMNANDEQSKFTMKLINKRGSERKRQVVLYTKTDPDDNEKTLIRFLAPADVKGVGLLSVEDSERETQWLYLPALKRVRRISSSEKTDSFMGSDFSYEDIEQNNLDDYEYTLLADEIIDGAACYVVQSIPVDEDVKKETAYSRMITWIRKDNHITLKVNFYNQKGDIVKSMSSRDIKRIGDSDKWRAHTITMKNVKTGHRTELHYENIQIDQELGDKYFTQRYLERGR